jgi:hypothetical protein
MMREKTMKELGRIVGILVILVMLVSCGPGSGEPTPFQVPTALPVQPTAAPQPTTPVDEAAATTEPSPSPSSPPPTPTALLHPIVLEIPQAGAMIFSPVEVRGQVRTTPFEATLRGRVYDSQGEVIGEAPVQVIGELGMPSTYGGLIAFNPGSGGPGRVEVAEISAKDGSVAISAAADVTISTGPSGDRIEIPLTASETTLPLHIMARVGEPNAQITALLRWGDGTQLDRAFTTLEGKDGRGLLVASLDWTTEGQPPQPSTQIAELQLLNQSGAVMVQKQVTMLAANDPNTQEIEVHWILGDDFQPSTVRVVKTLAIGTTALNQLLWGPPPGNLAGFTTALPTPQEVLEYPDREEEWGERVTLRKLVIEEGVATADFSPELAAYGGDPARAQLIREQIARTLKQFSTVNEVRITVDGEVEEQLQP